MGAFSRTGLDQGACDGIGAMRGKRKALRGAPFLLLFAPTVVLLLSVAYTKPNGAGVELSLLSVFEDNNDGED